MQAHADSQSGQPHAAAPCQGLNPAGVTTDWRYGPRLNPHRAPNALPAPGWSHLLAWGHAWWREGATGPCTLQLRSMETWAIGSAGVWVRLDESMPGGRDYAADFSGARTAQTVSNSGGVLGVRWGAGRVYHWWPQGGRKAIPAGLRGVLVTCQARAEHARRLALGVAADLYVNGTAQPPAGGDPAVNQDIGIGMIRPVTRAWQTFAWTSAAAADLAQL